MSRPLSTFGTSGMSRPSSAEQRSQDTSRLSERSTSPLTSALHREWSYVPTSTTGPNGPGTYDPKPLKHKERAARILAPHTREVPTIMASGGLIYILNSEADQADAASRQASSSVAMLTANQQSTSRSASTNNTVMRSASVASGLPGGRMSQLSRETAPTGLLSGGMIHYRTSSVGDTPPVGTYTLPPKVGQRSYTFGKARNPTFERLQSKDTDINSCPQGTWFATRQGNIIYGRPTTLDTPGIGEYVMNSTSPQRVLNASRATNSMKPERTSTLYQRPRVLAYSQKTDAQHLELGQYFSDAAYSSFKTRTHNAKLSQKKEIPRVRRRLQVTKNT